MFVTHLGE